MAENSSQIRGAGPETANMDNTDDGVRLLYSLDKEELIEIIIDDAKNWLAHDGLWFQALEKSHGMETAMDADREAWRHFTVVEAKRIMARLGIKPGGGIPALVECLRHRLYARLNLQQVAEVSDTHAVFWMVDCRVQSARQRKGMDPFPCKSVGISSNTASSPVPSIRASPPAASAAPLIRIPVTTGAPGNSACSKGERNRKRHGN